MPRPYFSPLPVQNFPAETLAPGYGPAKRAARFNRKARALAEAEALGIDLRDPFGPGLSDFDPLADCGRRDFGGLI